MNYIFVHLLDNRVF